jgi:hypothetical protein
MGRHAPCTGAQPTAAGPCSRLAATRRTAWDWRFGCFVCGVRRRASLTGAGRQVLTRRLAAARHVRRVVARDEMTHMLNHPQMGKVRGAGRLAWLAKKERKKDLARLQACVKGALSQ